MMKDLDAFVVIRSVGERTTELCKKIVETQVNPKYIAVISNSKPFAKAVKKTFELGIASKKKWLIALDADVLLFPNTIEKMVEKAEKLPKNLFMYEGVVLDKLSLSYRPAGQHLYRVSLLNIAKAYVPKDNSQLRAESYTRKQMENKGFLFVRDGIPYALHDFEQFYFDIYRTCFLHARKHQNWIPIFLEKWARIWESDKDFLVAFKGLSDGILLNKPIINTPDFFFPFFERFKNEYSLKEKTLLDINFTFTSNYINEISTNFNNQIFPQTIQNFSFQFKYRTDNKVHYNLSDYKSMINWKFNKIIQKIGKLN